MAERKRVAKTRRREKKNVPTGHVHVQATFNNTIITITDPSGATIAWGSAGVAGFKGSRGPPQRTSRPSRTTAAARPSGAGSEIDLARYTESVCRLCRREGTKLFLKGARCYTKKCAVERRATPPRQHGVRRRQPSEFGVQLREKQKGRRVYSVLGRQFRGYFEQAASRPGATGG